MQDYDTVAADGLQASRLLAADLRQRLHTFLAPLRERLDAQIDARLVRTFLSVIEVILLFRHRNNGLLLSELGGYLLAPHQAPAGTKRLSNLLRSAKWTSEVIAQFLWQGAELRRQELEQAGEDALLLWDESVQEKPESLAAEGLCAVRSSKAARLKRIKPGYYHPPGGRPVFVPGLHWVSLLLMGRSGPPTVAAMQWWSTRGEQTADARSVQKELLARCVGWWGRLLLHVWDRGYAGTPWVGLALGYGVRFVLRWPKHYQLQDEKGQIRAAWKIARGKRAWDEQWLRDTRRGTLCKVSVLALPVHHTDDDTPLWLVVARRGRGQEPWYLLTSEPIQTAQEAWKVVLAYARRWQIEMAFRFTKSELAMESPRLWEWERRMKLLLMVTLAYAFLLLLLAPTLEALRTWLLRFYCHRTGKRGRETPTPLYRLRTALSRLWFAYPSFPALASTGNSG